MAQYTDAFSSVSGFVLTLNVNETSTNAGANVSTVTFDMYINPPGNYASYHLDKNCTWSISINGVAYSGTFSYDFRSPNGNVNKVLKSSTTLDIPHDTNGSKTIAISAAANGLTPIGSAAITTKYLGLTDFTRVPSAPGIQGHTRTDNGATVNVTSGTANFYGTGGSYEWMWSYNYSNWNGPYPLNGERQGSATVTPTSVVYVVTRAVDSEGASSWSDVYGASGSAGIPSAPQAISAVATARNVEVTLTGSATDGGSGITGYTVQLNSGSGWGSPQSINPGVSPLKTTYTNLNGGVTYSFRAYATNAVGTSANSSTATAFVTSGGKRYAPGESGADANGWKPGTIARRFNGTSWVDITTVKRFDGTNWVLTSN